MNNIFKYALFSILGATADMITTFIGIGLGEHNGMIIVETNPLGLWIPLGLKILFIGLIIISSKYYNKAKFIHIPIGIEWFACSINNIMQIMKLMRYV